MSRQVAAITGAGSGIGRATALRAAQDGWHVAMMDLPQSPLLDLVAEIERRGGTASAHPVDVTDEEEVNAVFTRLSAFGELTGLFTAAGIDRGALAHQMSAEDWRRVLEVNTTGTFLVVRAALGQMLSGTGGSIVLCSSPAAEVGFAAGGATAYGASKGAISSMVRTLAVDYARYRIRVNGVLPGPTETPLMWASVPEPERAALRTRIESEVPLGRLAAPEEIAAAVSWLLSDQSSYTTGSLIGCDGGVLAKSSISI